MSKYELGDRAWYADRCAKEVFEVCPDCLGQKALTVIMGDGSQVSISCVGCASGYNPPTGRVCHIEHSADVHMIFIDRLEVSIDGTEYGYSGNYRVKETELFDTKEEAEKRALELAEEYNKEQATRKHDCRRSWAWNAHYHRKAIKQAEKDLAYHTSKLSVAKEKSKETK
jgi:hypothetical protein